jgi:arylsulfatase A-like enzyme
MKHAKRRPNIVLFLTDQQRWDSLGCYGADWVHTPNLDRLAGEGVRFDRCYVNNPICTPSRSSMWTGRELPDHGVYRLYDLLPRDEVFFTHHLRSAGYRTALFGKLHTSSRLFEAEHRHPFDGFDEYEWAIEAAIHLDSPFNGYSRWLQEHHPAFYADLVSRGRGVLHHPREVHFTHWAAERTIDYITRQTSGAADDRDPFFVCMSVFDPHNPYEDYPEEMLDRIDSKKMPPPLSDPRRDRPSGVERERHHSYLGDFDTFSAEDVEAMRRGYFASVALIDIEVGRVLDTLEERGVAEDTLVLFLSDHGDMLGDHDLVVKGAYFYEGCSRVPFLMRWPREITGGSTSAAVVQPHDIARTILDAAGVDPEEYATTMPDSRNLVPLAAGAVEAVRDYAVTAYRNSGINDGKTSWDPPINATMITDGRYKLSVYHDETPLTGELYDIAEDPEEREDRYADPAFGEVRYRLLGALTEWYARRERRSLGSRGGELRPGPKDQLDNRLNQERE